MERFRVRRTWVLAGILGVAAVSGLMQFRAARSAITPPKTLGGNGLIVHEWGTFTSFAGSDGVQLDFRPLLDSDLPDFVVNRQEQAGIGPVSIFAKPSILAPLRMETPVTYFYTDEPRKVQVRVDFPEGLLTEFYPPVRTMQPPYSAQRPDPLGPSQLDWGEVTLIPETSIRPDLHDDELSAAMAARLMASVPPHTEYLQHYAAARETDSALVAVNLPPQQFAPFDGPQWTRTIPPPGGLHVEKFLFYRGVGKFELPLKAEFVSGDAVRVTNLGGEPIRSLFLIDVDPRPAGLYLKRTHLAELAANKQQAIPLPSDDVTMSDLGLEIQAALEREGLFPKEAAAMVKTWSNSWFQEPGLRLFYIVPQSVTDRVLPLTVEPRPAETVRVLVGRMEILPPDQEDKLAKAVAQYRVDYEKLLGAAHTSPPPLPAEVQQLGRFAEPALVRVRELAQNDADANTAQQLISRLRSRQ